MKKRIILLMCLLLVVCNMFCACGNNNSKSATNDDNKNDNVQNESVTNSQTNATQKENNDESKLDIIEYEDYQNSFKTIELTTENWSEYFEVKDDEKSPKIVLRENCLIRKTVVSKITFVGKLVGYDDSGKRYETDFERTCDVEQSEREYYLHFIEHVKNTDNMQLIQCDEFVLQDIKCVETNGSVQLFTIPNDKWNVDENGMRYLYVEDKSGNLNRVYDYGNSHQWESVNE